MNAGLTKFIDILKDYKIKKMGKPTYGNEKLPVEYKLRSRDAEELNYNKMVLNMSQEKSKLKARLDVVGDPTYTVELRRQIMEVKSKIRAVEEARRKLTQEKFQREKKLNKVLVAGQPDAMVEIQKKVQEMTIIHDRLEKINKQLEFQQTTKEDADRKFEETQARLKDLESKAQKQNIDITKLDDIQSDFEYNLSKDPKTYERKEQILKQAIETDRQMYGKVLEDLRNKLVKSMKEKNEVIQKIRDREVETITIRQEVKELMLKSKLITEDEAKNYDYTNDTEYPEEVLVSQDSTIAKLNTIVKNSKKKVSIKKSRTGRNKSKDVPTTKNALNLRRKVVENSVTEENSPTRNERFDN